MCDIVAHYSQEPKITTRGARVGKKKAIADGGHADLSHDSGSSETRHDSKPGSRGESEQVNNIYVSYPKHVTLPAAAVSSQGDVTYADSELSSITVTNVSPFAYSAYLDKLPTWCISPDDPITVEPGESAKINIGLNKTKLAPGSLQGTVHLAISRPFIRLTFPFEVTADIDFGSSAPGIHLQIQDAGEYKFLVLRVTNNGTGLLSGFFYDRNTNAWEALLLPSSKGYTNNAHNKPDQEISNNTENKNCFIFEKTYYKPEEIAKGYLLLFDCEFDNLRSFDINLARSRGSYVSHDIIKTTTRCATRPSLNEQ